VRGLENAMTKADIVESLYASGVCSRKLSVELVDDVIGAVKETLASGERVKIHGFGVLEVLERAPRQARNPRTMEAVLVPSRRAVAFRASERLKRALNEPAEAPGKPARR